MEKILTLAQQRLVHGLRQCVGKTIPEIQLRPMPATPEVVVGLASKDALLQSNGFNHDGRGAQKGLCLPGGIRPGLPLEDNREFQMVHDAEAANVGGQNQFREPLGLRLFEPDRDQRGSIENRFGSPCSSYSNWPCST